MGQYHNHFCPAPGCTWCWGLTCTCEVGIDHVSQPCPRHRSPAEAAVYARIQQESQSMAERFGWIWKPKT